MVKRYLRTLRNYGWVANKWPEKNRSDKHGWTFYVENSHGEPIKKPKTDALPYYVVVRRFMKGGEEWQELEATGDKKIIARVPPAVPLEPERE